MTGALILALLALAALIVHLTTTDAEFSRDNLGWNGTSAFFSRADNQQIPEVYEEEDLSLRECTTLLVIAPHRGIPPPAIRTYRTFLDNGHTLLLADDFSGGGELCTALNASIRFLAGNLSSIDHGMTSPTAVIARRANEALVTGNASVLLLNRPSALEGGETLMATSVLSWIDSEGNGRPDSGEVLQRYPVIARERLGRGTLVVVGDASLFINAMAGVPLTYDNQRFLSSLLATPGLCLDQMGSRTAGEGMIAGVVTTVKRTYIIQLTVVASVLFTLAFVWRRENR